MKKCFTFILIALIVVLQGLSATKRAIIAFESEFATIATLPDNVEAHSSSDPECKQCPDTASLQSIEEIEGDFHLPEMPTHVRVIQISHIGHSFFNSSLQYQSGVRNQLLKPPRV